MRPAFATEGEPLVDRAVAVVVEAIADFLAGDTRDGSATHPTGTACSVSGSARRRANNELVIIARQRVARTAADQRGN
jgi:hypothetical protein